MAWFNLVGFVFGFVFFCFHSCFDFVHSLSLPSHFHFSLPPHHPYTLRSCLTGQPTSHLHSQHLEPADHRTVFSSCLLLLLLVRWLFFNEGGVLERKKKEVKNYWMNSDCCSPNNITETPKSSQSNSSGLWWTKLGVKTPGLDASIILR